MNERPPKLGPPAPPADEAERPRWDMRYRLVRTLGAGGMGRVLLAEDDLSSGRVVALKRMVPESLELAPSFIDEFRVLRQLAHPNIPRAYELGFAREEGVVVPYFTMEVSPGVPLVELLLRYDGGLPLRAVMQIVTGLLRALDHVHRAGWLHADLKPANLLVHERSDGLFVHLIDFGVALPLGRTPGEDLVITPEYAAPELLEGAALGAATDLYAVGLLLFELIERRRPWGTSDVEALWRARTSEAPPQLTATSCPPALAALVRRLLAPDPAERPESAESLLAELGAATGWEAEIEPTEAFIQRLLTVPLPWRPWLEGLAARVTEDPLPHGEPWAVVIDVPMGFFARRLLGPVLDEASARRARIIPVRFEDLNDGSVDALQVIGERAADDQRLDVYVVENLDLASESAFDALARRFGDKARLVATRRDPERGLPARLKDPGVLVTPLSRWDEPEIRGWLHRALGRTGGPWEAPEEALMLPQTPAALIEALAGLYRDGYLVRRGVGYVFRTTPTLRGPRPEARASALDVGRRPETLDALLACVKSPVPEAVMPTYLGVWSAELPELVASGVLVARGDGTVHVADEPRRATLYGRLPAARRHALHRRLAQALEEVFAPAHRVAEEWLDSDAPLLAVPHLLAAAEARPGRSWLPRAMALIQRARLLIAQHAEREDLELWRYEALALKTQARVLLACGELDALEPLMTRLVELGSEVGHRHTIQSALEIRLAYDLRVKDWEALVRDASSLIALESPAVSGVYARPGRRTSPPPEPTTGRGARAGQPLPQSLARLHWARALRFRAEGSPTAALAELEAGIAALAPLAEAEGEVELRDAPAAARRWGLGVGAGDGVDVTLLLLEARAELCLDVQWLDLAAEATNALSALARRTGRPDARARARLLEVMRLRMDGRLDKALASAIDNAEALPRERTPTLDAMVELELGWCRFELSDFEAALDHARCAAALAEDEGSSALMARAAVLEATTAWYGGAEALAWRRAQEAVRAGGSGADSVAVNARLLVLELALAMRGFAGADEILREASEAGWRAHRRLERAREARAFRLAAEAALLRREPILALQHAERALMAARAGRSSESGPLVPRHLVTLGRARLANGARDAAEASFAEAREEVRAVAGVIEDAELRERWLAHPDQRGVLGKRPTHALA